MRAQNIKYVVYGICLEKKSYRLQCKSSNFCGSCLFSVCGINLICSTWWVTKSFRTCHLSSSHIMLYFTRLKEFMIPNINFNQGLVIGPCWLMSSTMDGNGCLGDALWLWKYFSYSKQIITELLAVIAYMYSINATFLHLFEAWHVYW